MTTLNDVRNERPTLLKIPPGCAVSLTLANRGENEKGMQIVGGPPSQLVTTRMLHAAKLKWEVGTGRDGAVQLYEAELHDLSAKVDPALVERCGGEDAAVLVLRNFAPRLIGDDACDQIEHELETQLRDGKIDKQALMRGVVKNKNARWNNVMADFDQEPAYAEGRGTVVKIADYPFIHKLAQHAGMWLQQGNPLVCEQNRYFDVKSCGIGFHGCALRNYLNPRTPKTPALSTALSTTCLSWPYKTCLFALLFMPMYSLIAGTPSARSCSAIAPARRPRRCP